MKLTFLYFEFENFSPIIKIACCRNTETHPFHQIDGIVITNLVDFDS